jgi:hypothetical protein
MPSQGDNSLVCSTKDEIISSGGLVVENEDGTVSVYVQTTDGLSYQPLTKPCCEALATISSENGPTPMYTFDIDNQKCRWGGGCYSDAKPFKVVMNPLGNDGVIFNTNNLNNEHCTLKISFDYLFQINCNDILARLNEVSNNNGLDAETQAEIDSLTIQQERCQRELETYYEQLIVLQNQLNVTPFVIQCTTDSQPPIKPVKWVSKDNPSNLDIGFGTTVMKFPLAASNTSTYCLTDAGLDAWQTILGSNNYNLWFNSNGTNKTTYTCVHVNMLLTQDNNNGNLLGSCDVSLTARDEKSKELIILQSRIKSKEEECQKISANLDVIRPDITCSTVSEIIESLNVSMTLDMYNQTTELLETVYEESLINIGDGNLAGYLTSTTPNTGFYSSASTSEGCNTVFSNLSQELQAFFPNSATTEVQALVNTSFDSPWLHFETEIIDQSILDTIYNEKIKLSFLINECCVDFGIIVDRIKLTKNCSLIDNVEYTISKNPSFDLVRVIDNKKSWIARDNFEHRDFDLKFRDTQYDINNYKLAINTKEVDLDINPSNAIEQDLYCYIKDNSCLITCFNDEPNICTGITYEYSCPSGYTQTADGLECFYSATTAATYNGDGPTIVAGSKNIEYSMNGAYFYTNQTNNESLPLFRTGNGIPLFDQTGGTITFTNISNSGNTFWDAVGSTANGRLNNVGLSASTSEWLGFSHCLDLVSGGTYYIAIGADNQCRFRINGELFVELTNITATHFRVWHVFPYDFVAGKHIIEMEGRNAGSDSSFGAEIYFPSDLATLTGATTTGQTGLIFSTAEKIGDVFDLGTTIGYSCPSGWSLDLCAEGETGATCVMLNYTAKTADEIITSGECVTCGDECRVNLSDIMTTPLSGITTVDEFRSVISSELIDVKHWKTQASYPTLRLLYERYLNAIDYCGIDSSQFNYIEMMNFSELVGTYWVDLIEQVVPSTTIWGSTYVYGNTIFDQQKFQYKKYTLFDCREPNFGGPVVSPATGSSMDVEVITQVIENHLYDSISGSTSGSTSQGTTNKSCYGVNVIQTNCGSEFIGTISIIGDLNNGDTSSMDGHKVFNTN